MSEDQDASEDGEHLIKDTAVVAIVEVTVEPGGLGDLGSENASDVDDRIIRE